jgi:DNA-binding MarR family transcriptional regulator
MGSIIGQSPSTLLTYSLVWGWLHFANKRFDPMSSGQMLTAMTIIMLHDLGYEPTVSDLTRLTGMPKSSVSRYVSREMELGFLEEYVDQADRRQRRLRATAAARPELKKQCEMILALFDFCQQRSNQSNQISHEFIDELEEKLASLELRIPQNI